MAPFDFSADGLLVHALVFGLVGFSFGAVLEMAGFGDSRKLAAQFYLADMTVLKVMFTGIVVAAVLVAGATGFGLLDMSRVWINPTYLWPGIVGGLIMGVGFALGGFCPGTSVVAAATLKVDGILFLAGVLVGVWLFGETAGSFSDFFISSNLGRFTLAEWLGLPVGVTVMLVVLMALGMFWASELAEQVFDQRKTWTEISLRPHHAGKLAGMAVLVLASLVVMVHGQPTPAQKFELLGPEAKRPVIERSIFVHPAEVVALRDDLNIQVAILDLRDEHDFNLFHLGNATRVDPALLSRADVLKPLLSQPATTVTFLASNGGAAALDAWKSLRALGVQNLYVIEGGINRWLALYPVDPCVAEKRASPQASAESLAWQFTFATGSQLPAAWPELRTSRSFRAPCPSLMSGGYGYPGGQEGITWPVYQFTSKVKLESKAAVKGGCG